MVVAAVAARPAAAAAPWRPHVREAAAYAASRAGSRPLLRYPARGGDCMAKDHGSSVNNDKQYEGLRKKGMSKERAAKISNANAGSGNAASKKGGRKGGKKSGSKSS
jgi:hypothetical protein